MRCETSSCYFHYGQVMFLAGTQNVLDSSNLRGVMGKLMKFQRDPIDESSTSEEEVDRPAAAEKDKNSYLTVDDNEFNVHQRISPVVGITFSPGRPLVDVDNKIVLCYYFIIMSTQMICKHGFRCSISLLS